MVDGGSAYLSCSLLVSDDRFLYKMADKEFTLATRHYDTGLAKANCHLHCALVISN